MRRGVWVLCLVAAACRDGAETPDAAAPPPDAAPGDPYGSLRDDALKGRLYDETANHTALGYDAARDAMYVSPGFDVVGGEIECIYTGIQVAPDGTRSPGTIQTEHSWPQSLGAAAEPARSDMHHLFPADATANVERSNHLYGWAACDGTGLPACRWSTGGSQLGTAEDGVTVVFQARPERRGDVARATFYFAVRYQLPIGDVEEATLRVWSLTDPPDDLERARNDAIFALQHNRNPFVDRPDLIARISDF